MARNIAGTHLQSQSYLLRARAPFVAIVILSFTTNRTGAEQAIRTQTPDTAKRCEVRSISYSPDGHKLASFVMYGHDSGYSETRPVDVTHSIVVFESRSLNRSANLKLDYSKGPEECCLAIWNGAMSVTNLSAWYKSVTFAPDGKSLYVVDPNVWQIRTWNIKSTSWDSDNLIHVSAFAFAMSPQGDYLAAVVPPHGVAIWKTKTAQQLLLKPDWDPIGNWGLPEFSPDGKCFAVVTPDGIQVRSNDSQKLLGTFFDDRVTMQRPSQVPYPLAFRVTSLAFSPNGKNLVIGSTNGVYVFNVAPQNVEQASKHRLPESENALSLDRGKSTRGVVFSRNGEYLATWGNDGLRFYSASKGYTLHRSIPNDSTLTVAFSPDCNTYAVGNSKGKLTINDVATGNEERSVNLQP